MTISPSTVIRSTPGLDEDFDPAGEPTIVSGPPLPRQCGRCRSMFPGYRALGRSTTSKWWACPSCRIALFGNDVRPRRAAWATTLLTSEQVMADDAPRTVAGLDDGARR